MATAPTPPVSSPAGLELRSKPAVSARLNRKLLFVVGGVGAAVMLFVITNLSSNNPPDKNAAVPEPQAQARITSAAGEAKDMTRFVPDAPVEPMPTQPPPLVAKGEVPALKGGQPGAGGTGPDGKPLPPSEEEKELALALKSDTALTRFGSDTSAPALQGSAARAAKAASSDVDEPANEPDLNRQAAKRQFMESHARPSAEPPYKVARPQPPLSEFEVKTGTVIPALLVTEINSDLPGDIVAQVSQNVFDSATGRHLLVPQGTKLFGRYDSQVAFGQTRLLVAWQRLIYPDGSTLDLDGMAGVDSGGKAGFSDRVNNHLLQTFGAAILTSLFTAGLQVSQPQPAAGDNRALTTGQVAAGAVGQQMGQLGIEITRRYLRVQPTIEIRKGHRFAVMVSKDLVFAGAYGERR